MRKANYLCFFISCVSCVSCVSRFKIPSPEICRFWIRQIFQITSPILIRWKTRTSPTSFPTPIRGTGSKRKFHFSNVPTRKLKRCIISAGGRSVNTSSRRQTDLSSPNFSRSRSPSAARLVFTSPKAAGCTAKIISMITSVIGCEMKVRASNCIVTAVGWKPRCISVISSRRIKLFFSRYSII